MKKFYFNTGVSIDNNPHIKGGIDSGNGTVIVPFECENVPDDAIFLFACDSPKVNRVRGGEEGIIHRKIHNSPLLSEYAYFKTPTKDV